MLPVLAGGMLPLNAEILADLQIEGSGTVTNRISGGVSVKLQGNVPTGSPIGESTSLNFAKAATGPTAYLELTGIGNPRSFSGSCALRIIPSASCCIVAINRICGSSTSHRKEGAVTSSSQPGIMMRKRRNIKSPWSWLPPNRCRPCRRRARRFPRER